jgi:hypothetical protein
MRQPPNYTRTTQALPGNAEDRFVARSRRPNDPKTMPANEPSIREILYPVALTRTSHSTARPALPWPVRWRSRSAPPGNRANDLLRCLIVQRRVRSRTTAFKATNDVRSVFLCGSSAAQPERAAGVACGTQFRVCEGAAQVRLDRSLGHEQRLGDIAVVAAVEIADTSPVTAVFGRGREPRVRRANALPRAAGGHADLFRPTRMGCRRQLRRCLRDVDTDLA